MNAGLVSETKNTAQLCAEYIAFYEVWHSYCAALENSCIQAALLSRHCTSLAWPLRLLWHGCNLGGHELAKPAWGMRATDEPVLCAPDLRLHHSVQAVLVNHVANLILWISHLQKNQI